LFFDIGISRIGIEGGGFFEGKRRLGSFFLALFWVLFTTAQEGAPYAKSDEKREIAFHYQ
jgi:hypothetical protein